MATRARSTPAHRVRRPFALSCPVSLFRFGAQSALTTWAGSAAPILFNPAGNRKLFITFEDDQSWAAKGAYAKAKGLAGVVCPLL